MNHFTLKKIIFIKPQKHTQKKELMSCYYTHAASKI